MVGRGDLKRYKLEDSFKSDAQNSMEQADVVGVIQDMTRVRARESISDKLISLLELSKSKANSILILNKIDRIKHKKLLLEVVKNLTSENVWPHFSDVFMISALTGDGVEDLRVSSFDNFN